MDNQQERMDLSQIREKLDKAKEGGLWRSIGELAERPEFEEYLHQEFPRQSASLGDFVNRRQFFKLMGASLALAGLTACHRKPQGKIVPFVKAPEDMIPGQAVFYASTVIKNGGFGIGILAETHEGRPTKIEGNELHAASLGSSDAMMQAEILNLYDPDRSQAILKFGRIDTWKVFWEEAFTEAGRQKILKGAGLRILTPNTTSPTFIRQMQAFLKEFPQAKWYQYDPVNRDNLYEGARMAFGSPLMPVYDFARAQTIVSLDSDFLFEGPAAIHSTRKFSEARRLREGMERMNRLYVAETMPSVTGSIADHRLRAKPSQIASLGVALAQALGVSVNGVSAGELTEAQRKWVEAAAQDLKSSGSDGMVTVGDQQPAALHAIACAINAFLQSRVTRYIQPAQFNPGNNLNGIRALAREIQDNTVEMLLILGGNPVYNAPADLKFEELIPKVKLTAHLSRYTDETSALCVWHLPESHPFETWGDARAFDGSVSLLQPLIGQLYPDTRSALEVITTLAGISKLPYDLVKETWAGRNIDKLVHDGVVPNTAFRAIPVSVPESVNLSSGSLPSGSDTEIAFLPDPLIGDGSNANNTWLQEIPKPTSKVCWDNVAYMSLDMAARLGVKLDLTKQSYPLMEVKVGDRTLVVPAFPLPGHADGAITLHLGYGRTRGGQNGSGTGFNAYTLRGSDSMSMASGAELSMTRQMYPVACTEAHHVFDYGTGLKTPTDYIDSSNARPIMKVGSFTDYKKDPHLPDPHHHAMEPMSMYAERNYKTYDNPDNHKYAWAMVIDPQVCTGCNACVAACQAENNISVVGKDQVIRQREMHWIRVDRYYKGPADDPELNFLPVTCMQCEKAPCEVVCPVAATVHSEEGLNQMVYNRCVGTRYCSNNCPYKVRRFNFYKYADFDTPVLKLLRNPNVSVRGRGVMEKCTYCVQRINLARINAKKENRRIREGEVVTACQQACPAQAIAFGDMNDPNSKVSQWRKQPQHFVMLEELNVTPRTTYLARVRNYHPELAPEEQHAGDH